jgi:hypothetical protein
MSIIWSWISVQTLLKLVGLWGAARGSAPEDPILVYLVLTGG